MTHGIARKPPLTAQAVLNILPLFFRLGDGPIGLRRFGAGENPVNQSVMPSYGRADIAFEKGEGPLLYRLTGKFQILGPGLL